VLEDIELSFRNETQVEVRAAARVDAGSFTPCVVRLADGVTKIQVGKVNIGTIVVAGAEKFIQSIR